MQDDGESPQLDGEFPQDDGEFPQDNSNAIRYMTGFVAVKLFKRYKKGKASTLAGKTTSICWCSEWHEAMKASNQDCGVPTLALLTA